MAVLRVALSGDHLQGGKDRENAVPHGVTGVPFRTDRHLRVHPLPCLELEFFTARQNHGAFLRLEVKPHGVSDLPSEHRVLGEIAPANHLKLPAVCPADLPDHRLADSHLVHHRATAPVEHTGRPASSKVLRQGFLDALLPNGPSRSTTAWFVSQARHGFGREALPSLGHRSDLPLFYYIRST